jgi:structural maintenance of chromosomes protein 6
MVQTLAETAAEARLKAQNDKHHYEKKCAEEKKQLEVVEAAAKVLQEEFTVCLFTLVLEATD